MNGHMAFTPHAGAYDARSGACHLQDICRVTDLKCRKRPYHYVTVCCNAHNQRTRAMVSCAATYIDLCYRLATHAGRLLRCAYISNEFSNGRAAFPDRTWTIYSIHIYEVAVPCR